MHESPLVLKAEATAKREHSRLNQTRSNGDPYWTHPQRVVQSLVNAGVTDEVILAAAWLHDVPEDCTKTREECDEMISRLAVEFSTEIADTVKQLTNWIPKGTPFPAKQASLIEHAKAMNDRAKMIKVADRLDNLSGMETWPSFVQLRYARAGLELISALEPIPEPARGLADSTIKKAKAVLAANKA